MLVGFFPIFQEPLYQTITLSNDNRVMSFHQLLKHLLGVKCLYIAHASLSEKNCKFFCFIQQDTKQFECKTIFRKISFFLVWMNMKLNVIEKHYCVSLRLYHFLLWIFSIKNWNLCFRDVDDAGFGWVFDNRAIY